MERWMERWINGRGKQIVTAADRFPSTGQVAMESKAPTVSSAPQDEHVRGGRKKAFCRDLPAQDSDCKKQKM